MHLRERRMGKLVPVVGGVTAAATAVGAWAPATQVAMAQPGGVDVALGAAGPAQEGVFEACSAYFGFGKEEGVSGVVAFDVADVNGADGVAHAVPTDTEVVLVLENDEGETLECTPVEVTEEQWNDEFDPASNTNMPAWPGPGHHVYPTPALDPFIDDFGPVVEVGFRVLGIPGQHTLVSPTGVHALDSFFLDPEDLFFLDEVDPRVSDLAATEVDADAGAAYAAAIDACMAEEPFDDTDPDLLAAVQFLAEYIDSDPGTITEVDCNDLGFTQAIASGFIGANEAAAYVEDIRLSVPEAPPAPPAPPAPAAQPTVVTPTFTG
jgi:hypothetical protein